MSRNKMSIFLLIAACVVIEHVNCYALDIRNNEIANIDDELRSQPSLAGQLDPSMVSDSNPNVDDNASSYDQMSIQMYDTPYKRNRARRTRPRTKDSQPSMAEALSAMDQMKAGEIVRILQRIANRKGISLANKTLRYGISR